MNSSSSGETVVVVGRLVVVVGLLVVVFVVVVVVAALESGTFWTRIGCFEVVVVPDGFLVLDDLLGNGFLVVPFGGEMLIGMKLFSPDCGVFCTTGRRVVVVGSRSRCGKIDSEGGCFVGFVAGVLRGGSFDVPAVEVTNGCLVGRFVITEIGRRDVVADGAGVRLVVVVVTAP